MLVYNNKHTHTYSRGKNSLLLIDEMRSYLHPTNSDMQLLKMLLLIVVF